LFCVERVGARLSENAGAELEENAPGFSGHAKQLSKPENEGAQEYLVRRYEHNYFRGWVVGTQRQLAAAGVVAKVISAFLCFHGACAGNRLSRRSH
jgi:hypothetical protein